MNSQAGRSALRLIQAHARREASHWYIPLGIRGEAHEMLMRATGAEIIEIGCRPTVAIAGRAATDRRGDVGRSDAEAALRHIAQWCRGPDDVPERLLPHDVPAGTLTILERMGLSAANTLALTRVLHHSRHDEDGRTLHLSDDTQGRRSHYANGPIHWRNGIVTIRRATLPDVLASALTGSTLDQVVDDPTLAGMRIRLVPTTRRRDGVLQIITADAGRRTRPGRPAERRIR